ncbi:MAG TPA: hypothetical protein PLZ84_05235, partial [Clostridia bacterium]|nr:hypothetical protein [Clostridia bacterium]
MKRTFRIVLTISLAMIIIGIILTVWAAANNGFTNLWAKIREGNPNYISSEQTLEAEENATNIRLEFVNASIKFSEYDGTVIRVTYYKDSRFDYQEASDSDTITVIEKGNRRRWFSFSWRMD